MTLRIRNVTLSFTAKVVWIIVCTILSPTQADNVVTCDRAGMLAALVVGLEMDFTWILIAEIHERAFKTIFTLPIPCLIFHLFRLHRYLFGIVIV